MDAISLSEARNLALAAQGFASARPGLVSADHLHETLRTMALVQLDSVNVVHRSHYLPFFARLGAYDRASLDELLNDRRKTFEQWGHVASVMPIECFPLLRHRWEQGGYWKTVLEQVEREHPGLADAVLQQVRDRGQLTIADLEGKGPRQGPWWGYAPGKQALEALFHGGVLAVSRTANFSRVYALTERVFAEQLREPAIPADEAQRRMLLLGARAHGIGTARDIADYFRIKVTVAMPRLRELVDDGVLQQVRVEGWKEAAYIETGTPAPPAIHARALLTPFDPVVWERARTERLFNFFYRIEIYTPAPKRVHGYYVMPFLLGNDLVGRVDLKANRQEGVLEAFGVYAEPGVEPTAVAPDLLAELHAMAEWLGLERVRVHERGDLAPAMLAFRQ